MGNHDFGLGPSIEVRGGDSAVSYGFHPQEKTVYSPLRASAGQWPLQTVVAGVTRWREGDFWCREKSSLASVEYVSSGELRLMQDGKESMVRAGQAYFLRKGSNHRYTAIGGAILHKRYIDPEGFLFDSFVRLSGMENVDVVTPADPVAFGDAMKKAVRLLETRPLGFGDELSKVTYEILLMYAANIGTLYSHLVRDTMTFIQGRLDRPIANDEIARHAGVSVCHLHNCFKKELRLTPMQYHSRERIALAHSLLTQMNLSVKQAAQRAGFEEQQYFSKVYRKWMGHPPSQR